MTCTAAALLQRFDHDAACEFCWAEIDAVTASHRDASATCDVLDGVHDATKPCATLFGPTMMPTADPFHHRYVDGKSMSATASAQA